MTDEVKSAMTAEEWAAALSESPPELSELEVHQNERGGFATGFCFRCSNPVVVSESPRYGPVTCGCGVEWEYPGHAVSAVKSDHALAALALHGQPFGFTWEMHAALVDALECSGTVSTPDDLTLAMEAADRIAALLPPREP